MPNYCNNTLTLRHSDKNKIDSLHKACLENKLCHAVIPLPDDLKDTIAPSREPNDELLEKYGVDNWYDFCTSRWGTKWDIFDTEVRMNEDDSLYVMFTTAWSPPIGVYQALLEQGYDVEAKYFEGGMGFAGTFDNNGDYYYEDMSNIPNDLDEEFGISEWIKSIEDEEDE